MSQESRLAIVVDSSQARPSAENLARAMRALDDAGVRVSNTTADVGAQMDRMAGQSNAAAAALRRGLIAALGSLSTMKIIDIADEWGQYASRIRMATNSVEEYDAVQARMLASANATYRSINETREAFIQMSPVIRSMGASLEQSMDVVDAFSGLLVVNSASGERAASAMRALTLSMQKGRMDAQNWMTIASTMPSLIDEIAAHTGKSAAEIRKMGADGKLSIQMLVDALGGRYEAVMKKVADMPTTVRDALTNVSNAFGEYIGRHNEANQVTATLAAGIEVLGNNIETALNYALVAGAGVLVSYTGGMTKAAVQTAYKGVQSSRAAAQEWVLARAQAAQTEATLAQVRALATVTPAHAQVTAATIAHEQATKRLATAQAAARGVGVSLLGVLLGPVGMAITAGLVASAFLDMGSSAKAAAVDVDALTRSLGSLNKEQLALRQQQAEEKLEKLRKKAVEAEGSIRMLEREYAALNEMMLAGRGVTAEELENVNKTLVEQRAKLADTNEEAAKTMGALAQIAVAASDAAAGISTLNKAQVQTNDAAKSYLERMSDRALLAGLKTQREQLEALVKAGKLVFSPEDLKRAREWADTVDRANAAAKLKDPGADTLQSLKERIALLGKQTEYEQTLARIQIGALDAGKHKDAILQEAQRLDVLQHQIETERILKDLRDQRATTQMQYMRELASFGAGENVRALNADLAKVEDQYRRLIEARRNSAQGLSETELTQIQASLQEELDMVRWYHNEKLKIQQDGTLGALDALRTYADDTQKLYDQVGNVVKNAFKGMEDALAEFVKTGKLDFKSLADSIIQDMIRIAVQQSITGPLARAFGGLFGGFGGVSPPAGVTPGANWTFSSGGYTGDGGKFEPAGIVHRGEGVLNQAEIRALGGEAGFNALRRAIRGPGHAAGGMAGRPILPPSSATAQPQITVNVQGVQGQPEVSARRDQQGHLNIDMLWKQVEGKLAGGVQSGQGQFVRVMERKYGLMPRMG